MAIEIIPKKREEDRHPIGKIALYIGLGLVFLSIISSVAIFILTRTTLREIEEVRREIKTREGLERDLFNEIRGHHRRVLDFNFLLDTRTSPIPAFEILEKIVHPGVYFTGLRVNTREKNLSTIGMARDITAFDQQMRILEKEPMITSVVIESFTRRDDGQVVFPIVLTFRGELFN